MAGQSQAGNQSSNNKPYFDPKDVNIVLVGETGVGKSTFINAFVHYLKFGSLSEAKSMPGTDCLIPTKFSITDENFEERVISVGSDENESAGIGESSTQTARSYRFRIDHINVRLIDTPGIGDTRGVAKDEENLDHLLLMLGELKYVHAFCFLLKPNSARLTVYFQYCIKQLLSRLDKSASQNIVFIFTNSRSTFYKPGDTIWPLKEILKGVKDTPPHVDIPFTKHNVFCMDNEAFRFLLASKSGISFTDTEEKEFGMSWEKSVNVSLELLTYVANLKPHKMQNTISINEARRLILCLSEPLAQVAKNIDDNLRNIDRKQNELRGANQSIEKLREILHFDMIRLRIEDIEHPRTVCTHQDCTDVYVIEDAKYIDYKQVCHARCYLNKVPKQVVGAPELKRCDAMNASFFNVNPSCRHCDHSYSLHMHIYFITKPYTSREVDKKVHEDIRSKEEIVREVERIIQDMQDRKRLLEKEKETVQVSMAKFAHFLNSNAIQPYNDKYQEFITYLINNEKGYGQYADWKLIDSYEKLIRTHNEKIKILDRELSEAKTTNDSAIVISAKDVLATVQELYKLEINGELIERMFKSQQTHRQQETLLLTERNIDTEGFYTSVKKVFKKIKRMVYS